MKTTFGSDNFSSVTLEIMKILHDINKHGHAQRDTMKAVTFGIVAKMMLGKFSYTYSFL